jgi:hypothetical protein
MDTVFTGYWCNEEGNILVIKPFFWKRYVVKYIRRDGKLLFGSRLKLFLHMFPIGRIGKLENGDLVVSLRGIWGPWLHLHRSYSEIDDSEILLPKIESSISDGWEDVVGIPWLQPLSPFHRVT